MRNMVGEVVCARGQKVDVRIAQRRTGEGGRERKIL